MRKLWVMLCLVLVLVGCVTGEAYAAKQDDGLDGIKAMIVNNYSYLPLRDMAEVLALDISWDEKEKCVEIWRLNDGDRIFLEKKVRVNGSINEEGEKHWGEYEQRLSFTPILQQGKVWVPVSFFENFTEAEVSWDHKTQRVLVEGIPLWQEGKWSNVDTKGYVDNRGNAWTVRRLGEPTLGCDYLWRLSPTGEKERVCEDWWIMELKVEGDKCYYLSKMRIVSPAYEVYQVNCVSGERVMLGREDFVYNCDVVKMEQGGYMLGSGRRIPEKWRAENGGVWAVGISWRALGDNLIDNEKLGRESYGLYRLYPGGHELVKKYEFPE